MKRVKITLDKWDTGWYTLPVSLPLMVYVDGLCRGAHKWHIRQEALDIRINTTKLLRVVYGIVVDMMDAHTTCLEICHLQSAE